MYHEEHPNHNDEYAEMVDDESYSTPRRGAIFGHHGSPYDGCLGDDHHNQARVKLLIPSFTGEEDLNTYFEWEERCDQIFNTHGISEMKRVELTLKKFSGYALSWWKQLQKDHLALGVDYICSWDTMKRVMRHRFIPLYYEKKLYKRLKGFIKGSRTVKEYYNEMEKLLIWTKTQESDEAKMERFLHGLNAEISDFVEVFPSAMISDVVHRVMRVENKNMCNGRSQNFQDCASTPLWKQPHPSSSMVSTPTIHIQDIRSMVSVGAYSPPPVTFMENKLFPNPCV